MGDLTEDEYQRKISKSTINPLRYGRCRARELLDKDDWISTDVIMEHLYDLRRLQPNEES